MAGLYAFLVGIDTYYGGVPALRGCVNDVNRAAALLRHRGEASFDAVLVDTLNNRDAIRATFIERFRAAFAEVRPGDTAVFYYSGHGSQEPAPDEHLEFEPDGLNETLVLADSRSDGGLDLADKELAVLVGEVTARGAHVLVVLDCCHSGSGIRAADGQATRVRRVDTSTTRRSPDSYLAGTAARGRAAPDVVLGGTDYILIAACRSDQTAKEVGDGADARGALSAALEAVLTSTAGAITYQQLHRSLAALVAGLVAEQTPVLECPDAADADRPFLGGAAAPAAPLLTASHRRGSWQLDAGTLHGIPAATRDLRPTRLTLHGLTADDLSEQTAVASATTRAVRAATSALDVVAVGPNPIDPARTYRVVIRDLPDPDVTLRVDDGVPGRPMLLAALEAVRGVALVDAEPTVADLRLSADEGLLQLSRPGAARSLVAAHPLPTGDSAWSSDELDQVCDEVAQVGRWLSLWRRRNPTSRLGPDAVAVELLDTDNRPLPLRDGGAHVEYDPTTSDWPRVRIRVTNSSGLRLYVAVFALSQLYGVEVLLTAGGEWLGGEEHLFVPADDNTNDLYLSVPEGEQITTDLLKVLVSTTEFTASSLRQADLSRPVSRQPTRGPEGAERGLSTRRPDRLPEDVEDWTTRELLITTYRPGSQVRLPAAGETAPLGGGTVLRGHPTLRGNARLSAGSEASREARVSLLPSVLVDEAGSTPFSFLPTRSVGGEVDVLELEELTGFAGVSPEEPLVLQVPQRLDSEERVLALLFDGEDYLPVGVGRPIAAGQTEIRIVRVPEQTAITRKSLGRSLKILFRKLVGRRPGGGYDWPHLSLVDYDAAGMPGYTHDPATVRAAVAGASRVLLLVHGIIGDTQGMTQAIGPGGQRIAEDFDAVLAMDYENLHTLIETTAGDLAEALRTVGIGDGRSVRLTIVAHSMGGLVSRCFIEREGGNAVVDRLVTCGTPHAGSPWPRVEDFATSLLGLGLNGVIPVGGPLATAGTVLGLLARTVEHIDRTLDQMLPGSELLTQLAGSPDPGVRYVLVRGIEPIPAAQRGIAGRIVAKLTGLILATLFDGQDNDLAVSVRSATAVGRQWPAGRTSQIIDVRCSHLTYFSSGAGIAAVRDALG